VRAGRLRYARAVQRRAPGWIATSLTLLFAVRGAAQPSPCGDLEVSAGDELVVRPADRAEGVARDAAIVVRHPDGTDLDALVRELQSSGQDPCSREPICLFVDARLDGGPAREPVSGHVAQLDARTLAFVPDAPLRPSSDYFSSIARAGFERATRSELEFRTGSNLDREPPTFDPPSDEVRIAIDAPPEECDAPPGSVRVRIGVPAADDDGDDESVELLLFVTQAQGVRGPELRARRGNRAEREVVLTFVLDEREAELPVCVAVRAVDGVGLSSNGEATRCFDPVQDSHFAPLCSAGPAGRAHGRTGFLVALAAWPGIFLRRRRREHRRSILSNDGTAPALRGGVVLGAPP
jgi:hypothetical protein